MKGLCVALHYVSPPPHKSHVLEQGFVLISVISGQRCSASRMVDLPQLFVTYCKWSYIHGCFKKVLLKSLMFCCYWWVCWGLCFNHKRVQSFFFSFHVNLLGEVMFLVPAGKTTDHQNWRWEDFDHERTRIAIWLLENRNEQRLKPQSWHSRGCCPETDLYRLFEQVVHVHPLIVATNESCQTYSNIIRTLYVETPRLLLIFISLSTFVPFNFHTFWAF